LAYGAGVEAQAADQRVAKIFADWQKRQERIQTIRYKLAGEHLIAKGSLGDDYGRPTTPPSPPHDIRCPFERLYLFDFTTGLYRIEVSEKIYVSKDKQVYLRSSVTVFDGREVRTLCPRQENSSFLFAPGNSNPDMVISTGNMRGVGFDTRYLPLFFAQGVVRTSEDEIVSGRFKRLPAMDYFHVHGSGSLAGRSCLVLRTETLQMGTSSFDELWVDPGRDSAIVRYLTYSAGKPFNDSVIQYGKTTEGWLPQSWTFTTFTGPKTDYTEKVTVQKIDLNPQVSQAEFHLEPEPGMLVQEFHHGESPNPLFTPRAEIKSYRAGDLAAKIPFIGGMEGKRWTIWWLILATAVAGLFIWLLWRNTKHVLRKQG
jgi:outer membrane lipoprotein-sorting protein